LERLEVTRVSKLQPDKSNWYAVVSKPRQEQSALENLQRQGFECFLPMAENPYQRRSKKHQRIVEPLFPRYLFLRADASQQNLAPVRSTKGVMSMVRFGIELAVVPESVIHAIKMSQNTETGLIKIEPVSIKPGDKVRVFDGPLAGITGVVQETNSNNRAMILMELLGRPTTVKIDALNLQRAS
jgi:transcriptional antiterminator RfaH